MHRCSSTCRAQKGRSYIAAGLADSLHSPCELGERAVALWAEAANHYPEAAMAQLLLNIAMINFWNRTNVPVRTLAGPSL